MKGKYLYSYLKNPNINKPIKEIWDDYDLYTGEYFADEEWLHGKIDLMVPLPPMQYKGKFVKGLFLTQAADFLLSKYPDIKKLFHVGAYTMCSSYSWCENADLYFACYENKEREAYYKSKYPNKKDIIFLPLQDADLTNEYHIAPSFNTPKTIDVLMVATPYEVKNHFMLAKALKIYEQKYGQRLNTTCIFGLNEVKKNRKGEYDFSSLSTTSQGILKELNEILDNDINKYINIIPRVPYKDLSKYYTSAKCVVLTSLIEGKNRSLNEAMSCDTPIVVFKQLNQYVRGEEDIIYENSGEYAEEFTPEALAEAIHKVIANQEKYEPRRSYLKNNGRTNFINKCAKYIPYYQENIPEYEEGRFHENSWVNLAVQKNYQISYHDFLYDKAQHLSWVQGTERIDYLIKFYYSLFGINTTKLTEVL